jgi:hypothetical protein
LGTLRDYLLDQKDALAADSHLTRASFSTASLSPQPSTSSSGIFDLILTGHGLGS